MTSRGHLRSVEPSDGRRSAAAARRRAREADIVAATRELFDERGVSNAQIEDIAKAVGINRAIVYRHFTGKDEIFALTLVGYLEELRAALVEASSGHDTPAQQLSAVAAAFADYGIAHPAFVDCAQTLMRRSGPELLDEISEGALFRLGRAMTGCLSILTAIFAAGAEAGEFKVGDANVLANMLYASGLGALQLARVGIVVTEVSPGVPNVGVVSPEQVREHIIAQALAMAGTH